MAEPSERAIDKINVLYKIKKSWYRSKNTVVLNIIFIFSASARPFEVFKKTKKHQKAGLKPAVFISKAT
jgi:hypothetical protein